MNTPQYLFIAIISLLNRQNIYELEELKRRLDLSHEIFVEQLNIIQQLFSTQVQLSSSFIKLLTPIALFTNDEFFEFNRKHLLQVQVVDTCLSTNTLLLNKIKNSQKNFNYQVIVANEQIDGRGRQNHSWHSELGNSLIFSLVWQVLEKQDIQSIPLVIAVAIGRALRRFGITFQIKWPNDVVIGHQKLAGVLVESTKYQENKMLVIGIGINFNLAQDINRISLLSLKANINPVDFLMILLQEIEQALVCYCSTGFENFQVEFNHWHRDTNKKICLTLNQQVVLRGTIQQIAKNGALVIIDEQKQLQQIVTSAFSLQLLDD